MQVHEKKPTDMKVKTMVLFCPAPPSVYADPVTFDGVDLSDIPLPNGNVVPIVLKARYLGSMVSREGTDDMDVDARVAAATRAFGALSSCVFRSKNITIRRRSALLMLPWYSASFCMAANVGHYSQQRTGGS